MTRLTPLLANRLAFLLTVVGSLAMVGYVVGSRPLRGLALATAAAPFPKVFSDVEGLETFASEFTLHWRDARGAHELPITPELYARLRGAYNRRNVYGAALSYAPRLPEPLWRAVFEYAFAADGPLRREFGLPADAQQIAVEIRTRTRGRTDVWRLEAERPRT